MSTKTRSKRKNYKYPWEAPEHREDVTKGFSLRLSEPYLHKLRFIGENTPMSMQQFCQKVIKAAIDRKIRSLLNSSE